MCDNRNRLNNYISVARFNFEPIELYNIRGLVTRLTCSKPTFYRPETGFHEKQKIHKPIINNDRVVKPIMISSERKTPGNNTRVRFRLVVHGRQFISSARSFSIKYTAVNYRRPLRVIFSSSSRRRMIFLSIQTYRIRHIYIFSVRRVAYHSASTPNPVSFIAPGRNGSFLDKFVSRIMSYISVSSNRVPWTSGGP